MEIVQGGITNQTFQALENLEQIITQAGLDKAAIVKVNVYLKSMSHFASMNNAYGAFFGAHRPARTTLSVADLPMGADVEIECIAEFK